MKILNFGSCNIDYVYNVSGFVKAGETISALSTSEHPGGKGLNQAVAAARAGGNVFFAGNIGEDGLFLKKLLEDTGADTKYLKINKTRTGNAIVQIDKDRENCIIVSAGANALLDEAYIKSIIADFACGDICMLQNETPCTDYIIKQAKLRGMSVIWNPSPMNAKIKDSAIKMSDYIIINKTEGKVLTGKEEPKDILKVLLKKYPHTKIVITLGKNGSIYSDGIDTVKQSAFKAEPVDTTGAGDTFTGYFAAMISKGTSIEETLKIASAAAAIATEKQGAASSIPMLKEVIEKTERKT